MFNRILVPTDLSELAVPAVKYSLWLAQKMPSTKVSCFYASNRILPTSTPVMLYNDLKKDMLREDMSLLEKHVQQVQQSTGLAPHPGQLELHVENGDYRTALEEVLLEYKPDLIVMGTQGASGLKKYFFGSNTIKTLNQASCPVLAVPAGYSQVSSPHIVYATDLEQWSEEIMKVTALAKLLDAHLSVMHFYRRRPDKEQENHFREMMMLQLKDAIAYRNATVGLHPVPEKQEIKFIMQQMFAEAKPSLLVMFRRPKSWFEDLLTDSYTQEFLYNNVVPLLVFKS